MESKLDHQSLNSMVSKMDKDGNYPLHYDHLAAKQYFLTHVNQNTVFFHNAKERFEYLLENQYYDPQVFSLYTPEFLDRIHDHAYSFKFRFKSLLGAQKFFSAYSLKTRDGSRYLERYEDRVIACALYLAQGDEEKAFHYVTEIIEGRYQPATPTFSNSGKLGYGEKVSCFILHSADNLEDIQRQWANAAQLSKLGGGVGICITDWRAAGDPIKGIENRATGVIKWCKILESIFLTVDQLGQRTGAGVVWINALHMDAPDLIECKGENVDDSIRLKALNIGLVMPDILYEKAKKDKKICLFSPYDVQRVIGKPMSQISMTEHYEELVHRTDIRKRMIDAREYHENISAVQMESGYPFIMHDDIVNRNNHIKGYVAGSNLCSEILQVSTPSTYFTDGSYDEVGSDISCNLGSLNVYKTVTTGRFEDTVDRAVRMCTTVSNLSNFACVPSVSRGNSRSHAIGVGAMNLHGTFAEFGLEYGSEDSIIFTDVWFMALRHYALKSSMNLAKETKRVFCDFEDSGYADGSALRYYLDNDYHDGRISPTVLEIFSSNGFHIPTVNEWRTLIDDIKTHGLYNAYLLAVAPTGSVSYINHSTSCIHPVTSHIEERHEGKVYSYYPAPHMTNENRHLFKDAYMVGYEKIIDVYAAATKHVDQGLSLTLFFEREKAVPEGVDGRTKTRDLDKARYYAWKKGIKTLYYVRMRNGSIAHELKNECTACAV